MPVHPHTRGDIRCLNQVFVVHIGSPPHAWGHQHHAFLRLQPLWFTPTRVGTSGLDHQGQGPDPVHPHTRGDIAKQKKTVHYTYGSPPHAWGHPRCRVRSPSASAVHPHTRGDIGHPRFAQSDVAGSPPHAWGHRHLQPRRGVSQAVHPHTRGDIYRNAPTSSLPNGSPPHAWGHLCGIDPTSGCCLGSPPHAWGHHYTAP